MADVANRERTKAESVMDARLAEVMTEPIVWPYPNKVHLIAMDTPWAQKSITDAAARGKSMVLFFPDGDEVVVTPSRPSDMADKPWKPEPEVLE